METKKLFRTGIVLGLSVIVLCTEAFSRELNMNVAAIGSLNKKFVEFYITNNESVPVFCEFIRVNTIYHRGDHSELGPRMVSIDNVTIPAGETEEFLEGGASIIELIRLQDPQAYIASVDRNIERNCRLSFDSTWPIEFEELEEKIDQALELGQHDGSNAIRDYILPRAARLTRYYIPDCEQDAMIKQQQALHRSLWALKCGYITKSDAMNLTSSFGRVRTQVRYPAFGMADNDINGIWQVDEIGRVPSYVKDDCQLTTNFGVIGYCKVR